MEILARDEPAQDPRSHEHARGDVGESRRQTETAKNERREENAAEEGDDPLGRKRPHGSTAARSAGSRAPHPAQDLGGSANVGAVARWLWRTE